jgi:branched-chain amino acid transport system permease protein
LGTLVLQAAISGILTGGVYALMAAGLTLIFGVMDIINVAQGILVVLGAYLSYVLSVHLGVDLFLGLFVTIPAMFVFGVLVQWVFISRLGERERTAMSILATYSVAIIIEGGLGLVFGENYVQLNAWYVNKSFYLLGFYLPYIYVFGFLLAIALLAALYLMLYRTHFGSSVRATMQDRRAAQLVGIDVSRVAAITFGIGVSVTAAGGMVFGATNSFNPNTGYDLISRLLAIVILGGLGSIGGALAAAVAVLVAEDIVSVVWSPTWAPFIFFAMLIIVLSVKPSGFFGREAARAQ